MGKGLHYWVEVTINIVSARTYTQNKWNTVNKAHTHMLVVDDGGSLWWEAWAPWAPLNPALFN